MKGYKALPSNLFCDKNVLIGEDMVPHQFGEPMSIISYSFRLGIFVFIGGLYFVSSYIFAWSTTLLLEVG